MKRRRLDDGTDEFHQIEIEDLQDGESSNGIVLEMADRQRYFQGGVAGSSNKGASNGLQVDRKAILSESRNSLSDWEAALSSVCFFTRDVSQVGAELDSFPAQNRAVGG